MVALSDLYEDNVSKSAAICEEVTGVACAAGLYFGDPEAWKKMLQDVKPDVVFISTNLANHAPMAI